ncbi:MAG: hypothetical protein Q7R35_14510 [Elusimicrobiota bacterium]|nr:hypothetical protein [Elusimicrobiota bacterium]
MGIHKLTLVAMVSILFLPSWQQVVLRAAKATHRQILVEEERCAAAEAACDRDKIRHLGKRGLVIVDVFYVSTAAVYAVFFFWGYTVFIKRRKAAKAVGCEDRA